MKKFFIFLALTGFCFTSLAQKGVKEALTPTNIVIDGNPNEWQGDWWLDPDGKFLCNIANDNDNIYIRLKISDDLTQQKIALLGLSVKFDPNGKKKGKVGLKYPVGKTENELKKEKPVPVDASMTDARERVQKKKEMISDVEVVELIGLAKENIVSSRLGLANGIESIIVAQEDGSYIYESKIPFKGFRLVKSKIETLGVEFETGRLVVQQKNPNAASAGRSSGPVGYNNYNSYNPLSSPAYFWVGVKLK
jgi:hypothetical protein